MIQKHSTTKIRQFHARGKQEQKFVMSEAPVRPMQGLDLPGGCRLPRDPAGGFSFRSVKVCFGGPSVGIPIERKDKHSG